MTRGSGGLLRVCDILCSSTERCFGCSTIKTGTLIFLCLDLFVVIVVITTAFNGTLTGTNTNVSVDANSQHKTIGVFALSHIICGVVSLIIIVAGLVAVGMKKPKLLIPYFIIRSIILIPAVLIIVVLFFVKKILNRTHSKKSHIPVYSDLTGNDGNGYYASNGAVFIISLVFQLATLLQIFFVEKVCACYEKLGEGKLVEENLEEEKIGEELTENQGIRGIL